MQPDPQTTFIAPDRLQIGRIYYLDGAGLCRYEGTDVYHSQLTYKFWNMEYAQPQYELSTDRVRFYAEG